MKRFLKTLEFICISIRCMFWSPDKETEHYFKQLIAYTVVYGLPK